MKLSLALFCSLLLGTAIYSAADTKPSIVPASYPLKACPISGNALGEMGKPIKVTANGTDVYLCCKSCIKDFNADPARYAKMVTDAEKK